VRPRCYARSVSTIPDDSGMPEPIGIYHDHEGVSAEPADHKPSRLGTTA
jgi:hypothetical protein